MKTMTMIKPFILHKAIRPNLVCGPSGCASSSWIPDPSRGSMLFVAHRAIHLHWILGTWHDKKQELPVSLYLLCCKYTNQETSIYSQRAQRRSSSHCRVYIQHSIANEWSVIKYKLPNLNEHSPSQQEKPCRSETKVKKRKYGGNKGILNSDTESSNFQNLCIQVWHCAGNSRAHIALRTALLLRACFDGSFRAVLTMGLWWKQGKSIIIGAV